MPRKLPDQDLDFNIFVDPSCLSDPMDDETTAAATTAQSMAIDQIAEVILPDPVSVKDTSSVTVENIEIPPESEAGAVIVEKEETVPLVEEDEPHNSPEDQQEDSIAEPTPEVEHTEEEKDTSILEEGDSHISTDDQQDTPIAGDNAEEEVARPEDPVEDEPQEAETVEDVSILESEAASEQQETEEQVDDTRELADQDIALIENNSHLDEEHDISVSQSENPDVSIGNISETSNHTDVADGEQHLEEIADESFQDDDAETEDAETPRPAHTFETEILDTEKNTERSFPPSAYSDRKTSLRTEALIQAAARAVVARIEKRQASGDAIHQEEEEEGEHSILSTGTYDASETHRTFEDHQSESRRQSSDSIGSQIHHNVASASGSGDEGGESSSHNEAESDDVFSDRSARSSIASFEAANDITLKSPSVLDDHTDRHSVHSRTRSPRVSGVSFISDLSQYDKEDFIPTSRDTRIPFRTPSAIREIQMSSPTPSVFNGGSPRSTKRQAANSTGGMPTISRLGSPNVSTQFSPKGRSTPTRFKSRKEAPLVLLHVTLLPLRWMWGDVLNGLDAVNGKTFADGQQTFEASDQLKTLRDSWRELQDRVGDTVLERGVLLPHPQNDYEVLEERLLEALELPLRRRARILECGHYLGPSNEFADDEFSESEDEYASQSGQSKEAKKHWCNTCRNEIKYEDLGPGKVFRLQVYASNGLMRAGAWAACWKEMERVDVEVEPIVGPSVQNELEQLAIIQMEQEEQRQREAEREAEAVEQEDMQLPSMEQDLTESTAKAPQEESFIEAQSLPVPSDLNRSYMETPDQHRSSAMISSPPPSNMQITMHASPLQPPSTISTMRFTSPSPPPQSQSTPHPRQAALPEPIDMSEERLRRDEERLREIYGDMPLPLAAPPPETTPTSSLHTQPTTTAPRHPGSYIPPPSPRSPSEEAYERRARSRESHHHRPNLNLDNATFMDLMLEAFKVLLRDPKNVAIIVLCLFVMAMLSRPAQTGHELAPYRYDAKADVVMNTPAVQEVEARPSVMEDVAAVVVATTSGGVEASSVVAAVVEEETEVVVAEGGAVDAELEVKEFGVVEDSEVVVNTSYDAVTHEMSEEEVVRDEEESILPGDESEIISAEEQEVNIFPVDDNASLPLTEDGDNLPVNETEETPSDLNIESSDAEFQLLQSVSDENINIDIEPINTPSPTEENIQATDEEPQPINEQATTTAAVDPCTPLVISQKTTLRVYETVTETVTVSAVTAEETETASITETAVPQTVEETVYETETVRVTVSVVMDGGHGHDEL